MWKNFVKMDEAFAHIESSGNKKNKAGWVAPDGGWGYVVSLGVGFTFVSIHLTWLAWITMYEMKRDYNGALISLLYDNILDSAETDQPKSSRAN